uniref:Uncharacterized protein n=1 Tax=Populus trichocarpa TaxID=3694 RepID=A0A2K2CCQ5_POPTR
MPLGEEISGALDFLKDNKKKRYTPWYGGPARNVLAFDMVVFHDQFSKDSSLRSSSGWKLGRKLSFF